MAANKLPDPVFLRECLDYDPDTGVFTWRKRPRSHFPHPKAHIWWNAKFAGKVAGSPHKYWRIQICHNSFRGHRLAWMLVHGGPVPNMLDHIDGDPLNNRIKNLRSVTVAENGFNQKLMRDNKSGIKGVRLRRRPGRADRFIAYITAYKRSYFLGSFLTLEEATAARRNAAERLHRGFHRHE